MSNFASLHSGLVARKGEAAPAVSHASFSYVDEPNEASAPPSSPSGAKAAPQSVPQKTQSTRVAKVTIKPVAPGRKPGKPSSKKAETFRLTFRMTHDQRRRMRIAAAQKDESLQHILSDALDNYLDGLCACSMSECACMARAG